MKRRLAKATLGLMLLAMLTIVSRAAQTPGEPDITIVNFDWKYAGYVRSETVKGFEPLANGDASVTYKVTRATVYVFKYTAKASLKNTSAKTVKLIAWDYVFTGKENQKEIKRFKFQSKQQVPPGETATLFKEIGLDPKDDTRQLNGSKQAVEITRIEYADGSIWRR